jgi:hypothetical protein
VVAGEAVREDAEQELERKLHWHRARSG